MAKPVFSAKHFHDEQAAFDHIEALLWPNGPVCPHCGGEGYAMKVIGKASVRKDGTVKPAPIRIGVKKCRACHEVGPDAKNKIGPMLRGICDRTAGTSPGFGYSDAMKDAGGKGLKWTDEALAKYLTDPRGSLPGNKMAFPGIKDEADLKDLIAYLRKAAR